MQYVNHTTSKCTFESNVLKYLSKEVGKMTAITLWVILIVICIVTIKGG